MRGQALAPGPRRQARVRRWRLGPGQAVGGWRPDRRGPWEAVPAGRGDWSSVGAGREGGGVWGPFSEVRLPRALWMPMPLMAIRSPGE